MSGWYKDSENAMSGMHEDIEHAINTTLLIIRRYWGVETVVFYTSLANDLQNVHPSTRPSALPPA